MTPTELQILSQLESSTDLDAGVVRSYVRRIGPYLDDEGDQQ